MSLSFASKTTPLSASTNVSKPFGGRLPRMIPGSNAVANDWSESQSSYHHLYVLPVLLLEFLALALTRAVLPALLLNEFGDRVYMVMGAADFVRGILAFFTCPVFGKLSDVIGRRTCLFVTVLGTCAPVCSLAVFSWDGATLVESSEGSNTAGIMENGDNPLDLFGGSSSTYGLQRHHVAITVFIILFSLSGVFSSTFTLVFAYISDTVKDQEERVSAYGLALATFGLSFTLGPIIGGYLAQTDRQYVFLASLFLTLLDLLYIYLILPESKQIHDTAVSSRDSVVSFLTNHNVSWNPVQVLSIILVDPFLQQVAKVAFLYYTGLWALISTLSLYAVRRFHLSPERLGELISILGLSTMLAEAVLVRILVPIMGEKRAMKLGLVSFALQCVVLGFAYESWHLFVCAGFSLLGNLVYPSLSSLVSGSVAPDSVGEALGAINGIKALTEGFGPLVFGSLMTVSETSALPGWPYLLAAVLVVAAYKEAGRLPDPEEDDYVHELDRNKKRTATPSFLMRTFGGRTQHVPDDDATEEEQGLLSEVDESGDEDFYDTKK